MKKRSQLLGVLAFLSLLVLIILLQESQSSRNGTNHPMPDPAIGSRSLLDSETVRPDSALSAKVERKGVRLPQKRIPDTRKENPSQGLDPGLRERMVRLLDNLRNPALVDYKEQTALFQEVLKTGVNPESVHEEDGKILGEGPGGLFSFSFDTVHETYDVSIPVPLAKGEFLPYLRNVELNFKLEMDRGRIQYAVGGVDAGGVDSAQHARDYFEDLADSGVPMVHAWSFETRENGNDFQVYEITFFVRQDGSLGHSLWTNHAFGTDKEAPVEYKPFQEIKNTLDSFLPPKGN